MHKETPIPTRIENKKEAPETAKLKIENVHLKVKDSTALLDAFIRRCTKENIHFTDSKIQKMLIGLANYWQSHGVYP